MDPTFERLHGYGLRRHWSSQSEVYARPDVLLSYLKEGWAPDKVVGTRRVMHPSGRCSEVHVFRLVRDGEWMEMPVKASPAAASVVARFKLSKMG
jgi:hypothetical protein